MKNFGKLTAISETIKLDDDTSNPKSIKIVVLRDKDGVEWHDLYKQYPHKFYIAITDNNQVISMTDDPEQCQIPGFNIIGIDDDYGETYGESGTVYGKLWNGEKFVLPSQNFSPLTARQFWQAALIIGIKEEDIVAGISNEQSPYYVADEQDRESVLIDITKATHFYRDFPLLEKMAEVNNIPKQQIDALWAWAEKIL